MKERGLELRILRKGNIIRPAKSKLVVALHIDPDPVQALYNIKIRKENNTIHNIGLLFYFFLHHSTKQHVLYSIWCIKRLPEENQQVLLLMPRDRLFAPSNTRTYQHQGQSSSTLSLLELPVCKTQSLQDVPKNVVRDAFKHF